jgi:capsular exopolysaccharide synthesis family protein
MNLIFDALQRSVGERFGTDLSTLSAATELLQRIEHKTLSEWETQVRSELPDTTESAGQVPLRASFEMPPIAALHSAQAEKPSLNDSHVALFGLFKSVQVAVCEQNHLVCLTTSESLAAEKFRFLGIKLRHLRRERPLKKILITSTNPREGKSTVAANLACSLTRETQQRTLLVDGDLRRPSLAHLFGLGTVTGLSEWLQGDHSLTSTVFRLEGLGLWMLAAGHVSRNPLELLQPERLSLLIDEISALFDWIIIDSPPVLPLADTSVWSRVADGILLVTRPGITEKRQLERGLEVIESAKMIGTLLNCSQNTAHSEYYYHYHQRTAS